MEFVKTISSIIPFLAPYPTWVKLLVAGWLICTAVTLASLLLVRPDTQSPSSLTIRTPQDGALVDQFVTVEGLTKFRTLFHYIVVGPQTGSVWVTDGPLFVTEQGRWTGRAQLGTGTVGAGEVFLIHVAATTHQLNIGEGTMQAVEAVATAIATTTVQRKREEEVK